jgi:hypothetical protein
VTCCDHSTANADADGSDDSDMESQDDEDLGHGARPGGGFTSAVSIQPYTDDELKYILDQLDGYRIAQPVGSPEETANS